MLLTAVADAPVTGWREVARLRFGPGEEQLGHAVADPGETVSSPPAFAIGPAGTLWVLDPAKGRLVRFARDGRYLGSTAPLSSGAPWEPQDLAWQDGSLLVLLANRATGAAAIQIMDREWSPPVPVELDGEPVSLRSLIQGAPRPTATLGGPTPGVVSLAIDGGPAAGSEPGVLLASGASMNVHGSPGTPASIEISSAIAGGVELRPVRIRLVERRGSETLPLTAGVLAEIALRDSIGSYVTVEPAGPGADPALGGRWFFRLTSDGSSISWEPLPEPGFPDEDQVRHLAVGRVGTVYLMVPDDGGVTIFRRDERPCTDPRAGARAAAAG
jgi:hypothetical protein